MMILNNVRFHYNDGTSYYFSLPGIRVKGRKTRELWVGVVTLLDYTVINWCFLWMKRGRMEQDGEGGGMLRKA